eukprot:3853630-Amphidinium_carterae.3
MNPRNQAASKRLSHLQGCLAPTHQARSYHLKLSTWTYVPTRANTIESEEINQPTFVYSFVSEGPYDKCN